MNPNLSEAREREIFRDLLGHANLKSETYPGSQNARAAVAERYSVSLDAVIKIEQKGMARDWPPLD